MTAAKQHKPHGLWPGPVTPELIALGQRLSELAWSRDGRHLLWQVESSGEGALWISALDGSAPRQLTAGQSVRARVGYGGGHFAVGRDQAVFCGDGGRLYRQALSGGGARAITPPGILCASPALSPDETWVLFVFEVEGQNGLAIVDAAGRGWPRKVAEGHDFYMQPVWHPSGRGIAWVSWDHPNMPWDGSRLYTLDLHPQDGGFSSGEPQSLAGGDEESVVQPLYGPNGARLAYASDRPDWWHLHVAPMDGTGLPGKQITQDAAEYAGPAWVQGMRWFDWLPDGAGLVATRNADGRHTLVHIALADGAATPLPGLAESPYTEALRPAVNPVSGAVAALVSAEALPPRIVVFPPVQAADTAPRTPQVLHRSAPELLSEAEVSPMLPVQWKAADGTAVHGLYAAPKHPQFTADGPPPLIVNVHGGPTSQVTRGYNPAVQFFTGRGYAVLEVNHRGSTGYGRAYRDLLREQWGVVDVEDCVSGVQHLAAEGLADPARCAIRGGSAGGYTVLRALTWQPDAFRVGVCLYGISDLFALAEETHKFEAHYEDSLIGPLPAAAERYRERSPLNFAERITSPVIIFQGGKDVVVPPAQSEKIVASLARRGIAHEYHLYPEEGHGFRRRENLLACWQATERFLRTHLVFA